MEMTDLVLMGIPAALTAAKSVILAIAVVYAVKGLFQPYGRYPAPARALPTRVQQS